MNLVDTVDFRVPQIVINIKKVGRGWEEKYQTKKKQLTSYWLTD
jgi:hypothetical protein